MNRPNWMDWVILLMCFALFLAINSVVRRVSALEHRSDGPKIEGKP